MIILKTVYGLSLIAWLFLLLVVSMGSDDPASKHSTLYQLVLYATVAYPVTVLLFIFLSKYRLWWLPLVDIGLIAIFLTLLFSKK